MIFVRKGTKHGSKHIQLGFNNQDGVVLESFAIPVFGKQYHIGIVSDGCTGTPGFSKTEVGASLLPVYAFGRCQELICASVALPDIPRALFQMCTEFLRDLANKVMPSNILWGYPAEIKQYLTGGRDRWGSTERFRTDYLSATLLGFITDGVQLVTFSAGDGIIMVDSDTEVIDQDDKPDYPAYSINNPGKGFATKVYDVQKIRRLLISTDGLKQLLQDPAFAPKVFAHLPGHILGLQILLNVTFQTQSHLMLDDCTVVALENTTSSDGSVTTTEGVVEGSPSSAPSV